MSALVLVLVSLNCLEQDREVKNNTPPSSLDYSRVEVAVDARRRLMKLWFSTAIGPQQSRCSEIGSPER